MSAAVGFTFEELRAACGAITAGIGADGDRGPDLDGRSAEEVAKLFVETQDASRALNGFVAILLACGRVALRVRTDEEMWTLEAENWARREAELADAERVIPFPAAEVAT